MSDRTLGLDVGPTSVGWALVDEARGETVAAGVRVFPEGVDRDQQGGEQSKSQTRREARAIRRQIARRTRRRRELRRHLVRVGLLPADLGERRWVLEADPYGLRRRALDERLDPYEIGRVFVHLAQRRGFLSNRKTDRAKDSETKGMLAEIGQLAAAIHEAGCRTLGEYLAGLHQGFQHPHAEPAQRVRKRHTRRDMYEEEFDAIWESQRHFHPDLLTDALKYGRQGRQTYPGPSDMFGKRTSVAAEYGIHGLIFFQRNMYWPKSVIGRCELEPKQKRCERAVRAAQRFRMLQEVNNLRYVDPVERVERRLSDEQRHTLLDYLSQGKQRSFEQIRKKLGLPETVRFNLERGDRKRLQGHQTDASLSSKHGAGKRWKDLPDPTKDRVVHILLDEDREDEALRQLVAECGLTPDEARGALSVNLPSGHMNFSRVAILKLLPHLEKGMLVMGEDPTNSAIHAAGYLPRQAGPTRDLLPPSPMLTNPIVRQALVEVRKVVNGVVREFGRPDRIHVELAREAKKSFAERTEIRIRNRKREALRKGAATDIERCGVKPTRATVDRYILWLEQDEFCPYCGDKIGQTQLFSGDTDVDHILPRWRSLDNSLANKVVCHRACNRAKGDRTPREWLEDEDPARYERALRVADKLSYGKRRKFTQKDIVLDEFVARQLTDTAYISRCVTQYLRCLGVTIVCPRGQMTWELRHWWGLNTILDPRSTGAKNRADHRHHAIDAITIALINHKRLHALANARGKDMPVPWQGFRDAVVDVVDRIRVSHRALRRLHGALHEETFYGATQKPHAQIDPSAERPWAKDWVEQQHTYVRRKPVDALTNTKHLDKVRDRTIRDILKEHLRKQGIDPDKPGKIPGEAFKGPNIPRMPSGVPIRKVRLLEPGKTFRPASQRRAFQHVKPGSNHHIVYRAQGEGDNETWTGEVVTMWDAAQLARREGRPMVDRSDTDHGRFVMSLSIGEMFQTTSLQGDVNLCVVRKIRQEGTRIYYKFHTDARQAGALEAEKLYMSPKQMQRSEARKVVVDPIGRIRYAND